MYEIIDKKHFEKISNPVIENIIELGNYSKDLFYSQEEWSNYLRNYVVLTHKPEMLNSLNLRDIDILVNRYYWFKKFYHSYSKKNGKDVGIEQQITSIIEDIGNSYKNFDWNIIKKINLEIEV